jgi:hypothetical protein
VDHWRERVYILSEVSSSDHLECQICGIFIIDLFKSQNLLHEKCFQIVKSGKSYFVESIVKHSVETLVLLDELIINFSTTDELVNIFLKQHALIWWGQATTIVYLTRLLRLDIDILGLLPVEEVIIVIDDVHIGWTVNENFLGLIHDSHTQTSIFRPEISTQGSLRPTFSKHFRIFSPRIVAFLSHKASIYWWKYVLTSRSRYNRQFLAINHGFVQF